MNADSVLLVVLLAILVIVAGPTIVETAAAVVDVYPTP